MTTNAVLVITYGEHPAAGYDNLVKQAHQAPSFKSADSNFLDWEEQFYGWTSFFGIDLDEVTKWDPSSGDPLPFNKPTDVALYGILLRAFINTPYQEIIVASRQLGTTTCLSGARAWQALQKRFRTSRFSDKHLAATRCLQLTRAPDVDNFDDWEAKLRTAFAHVNRVCEGNLQDFLVAIAMGNIPKGSILAGPASTLNAQAHVSIDDFFQSLRAHQQMDSCQSGAADAGRYDSGLVADAAATSEIAQLKAEVEALSAQVQRNNGKQPRVDVVGSPCNRCGDPMTATHKTRTCPKASWNTLCGFCKRTGHLEEACRTKMKASSKNYSVSQPHQEVLDLACPSPVAADKARPVKAAQEVVATAAPASSSSTPILDSGATTSIVKSKAQLDSITGPAKPIRGLTTTTTPAVSGPTTTTAHTTTGQHDLTTHASVVPAAPHNVLSAARLTDKGYSVLLTPPTDDRSRIITPEGHTIPLHRRSGLWHVPTAPHPPSVNRFAMLADDDDDDEEEEEEAAVDDAADTASGDVALLSQAEAHVRFGHRNMRLLKHTAKDHRVKGMDISGPPPRMPCLPCASGKLKRSPATKGPHAPRATGPFQAFSVDATGQRALSRHGNRYAHSFRDLYTNRQATICTPSLSGEDTRLAIQRWFALWLPHGAPTRGIRFHADAAYLNGAARAYLEVLDMVPHGAAPHEHATHPAERGIGLLDESVTTMLEDARLPPSFWEDAAAHFDYVWNRSSSTSGQPPPLIREDPTRSIDVTHVHRFGALAYYRNAIRNKQRFQAKGHFGLYLGAAPRHTFGTLRIFAFESRLDVLSRSVTVFDSVLPGTSPNLTALYTKVRDMYTGVPSPAPTPVPATPDADVVLEPIAPPADDVADDDVPGPIVEQEAHVHFDLPDDSNEDLADDGNEDDADPPLLAAAPVCPAGHALVPTALPSELHCDNCAHPIPEGIITLSCQPCDYDYCFRCPGGDMTTRSDAAEQIQEVPEADQDALDTPDEPELALEASAAQDAGDDVQEDAPDELYIACTETGQYHRVYDDPLHPVAVPEEYTGLSRLSPRDRAVWQQADRAELDGLLQNKTLEAVDYAEIVRLGAEAFPTKFVRTKKHPDGDGRRRIKSRCVVQGHKMRLRKATRNWSAPVISSVIPKVMVCMALTLGLELLGIDIAQAFLKSWVYDDDIYIYIPDETGRRRYFRLRGALYGIPSAPGRWYEDFAHALTRFGLGPCPDDPCLFVSQNKDVATCIHVDDGLILAPEPQRRALVKHLEETFGADSVELTPFKHLKPTRYLGLNWTMDYKERTCLVNQSDFIRDALTEFGYDKSKPTPTPAVHEHLAAQIEDGRHPMYQTWTGTLQWILMTRPDIQHAVKEVSRHNVKNGPDHEQAVKRIFRYLNGTADLQLMLRGADRLDDLLVHGFVDASYAQCEDTRRSTSGLMFTLVGSPILVKSKLQSTVAVSACEAELYALFECGLYTQYLQKLLSFLGLPTPATPLHTDSQSAIKLLNKTAPTRRSKHIGVRWHKLKELLNIAAITLHYERTNTMPADPLTKNLDRVNFEWHRNRMMRANLLPNATRTS